MTTAIVENEGKGFVLDEEDCGLIHEALEHFVRQIDVGRARPPIELHRRVEWLASAFKAEPV